VEYAREARREVGRRRGRARGVVKEARAVEVARYRSDILMRFMLFATRNSEMDLGSKRGEKKKFQSQAEFNTVIQDRGI